MPDIEEEREIVQPEKQRYEEILEECIEGDSASDEEIYDEVLYKDE